jgi:mRNA interferase RelE/StbE
MNIDISKMANKQIDRLDSATRKLILKSISSFRQNPGSVDIKKLQNRKDCWRIRIGDWRIIIRIEWQRGIAYVLQVLNRRDAYRA